jgi:amino acid transporter
MSAIHAGDVENPKVDFPKALLISVVIVLLTLTLSSLAIAFVVSPEQLDLLTGFFDAFKIFLSAYHLEGYICLIVMSVIIGGLACAGAWMLGPSRALSIALQDTSLPSWMHHVNHYGSPVSVLIIQGILTTVLASSFFLMPTVSEGYWFLSDLSAQLALLFYLLLFGAAIKLRFSESEQERAFVIPGGAFGMILVGGIGILACFLGILAGFIPPPELVQSSVSHFVTSLLVCIVLLCIPIFFIRFEENTES